MAEGTEAASALWQGPGWECTGQASKPQGQGDALRAHPSLPSRSDPRGARMEAHLLPIKLLWEMMLEEASATALQGRWETHRNPSPRTQEKSRIRLPGQLGTPKLLTQRDSPVTSVH